MFKFYFTAFDGYDQGSKRNPPVRINPIQIIVEAENEARAREVAHEIKVAEEYHLTKIVQITPLQSLSGNIDPIVIKDKI
jgi:hypothetical protein